MVPRRRTAALLTLAIVLGGVALGAALLSQRETSDSPTPDLSAIEATASVSASATTDTNTLGDSAAQTSEQADVTPSSPDDPPQPTPEADTTVLALITRVDTGGNTLEIVVDPIEMYPIDESAPPAPEDPSANVVYNDTKESVRYTVSPEAIITGGIQHQTLSVSEWADTAVSEHRAYWLDVLSGEVIRIREQPIP